MGLFSLIPVPCTVFGHATPLFNTKPPAHTHTHSLSFFFASLFHRMCVPVIFVIRGCLLFSSAPLSRLLALVIRVCFVSIFSVSSRIRDLSCRVCVARWEQEARRGNKKKVAIRLGTAA